MVKLQQAGFIGLGKMGLPMVLRLMKNNFSRIVVYNRSEKPVRAAQRKGAKGTRSIADLVAQLSGRKVIWLMLPSGEPTEQVFQELLSLLKPKDVIIDGGNTLYQESVRHHQEAKAKGISFLDVGVSGGVVAAQRGYAMMVGGERAVYEYCLPLFKKLCVKDGFGYVGKPGAGHFVKMVHNAVEYGMMESIAEGFDLLNNGPQESLDLAAIAKLWNHGTIISSFLMEMTTAALSKDKQLKKLLPIVEDTGEGRWAARVALDYHVPFSVNTQAIYTRFASRDPDSFSLKLIAAMRNEFGGHQVHKK